MDRHIIRIEWSGPETISKIIKKMNRGGHASNKWAGCDYGVYQIYGYHILCGKNTLLYIGQAADQTFSQRVKQHEKEWLKNEKGVRIYLGRLKELRYTKKDDWFTWRVDVDITESVLIYKYTPHYNSANLWQLPQLNKIKRHKKVQLLHSGNAGKLMPKDNAPEDYLHE